MARRYGNYRLSDKSRSGGGLWWKLLVALGIGALFWLRFHHCEHPVLNPADSPDAPAEQHDTAAMQPETDDPIEHPPGAQP